MSTKRTALVFLVASVVLLATGIGPQRPEAAFALPFSPSGGTIPYPGRLNDAAGQPVAEGSYDFTFILYAVETGGEPLWSEVQRGVAVQGGCSWPHGTHASHPFPAAKPVGNVAGDRRARAGRSELHGSAPCQAVSGPLAFPASPKAGGACPHTHFGEDWRGSAPLWQLPLQNNNPAADTLEVWLDPARTCRGLREQRGGYGDCRQESQTYRRVF